MPARRVYVVYEVYVEDTLLHDAYEDEGDADRDATERNAKLDLTRQTLTRESWHFAVATVELKLRAPAPQKGPDHHDY